MSQKPLIFVTNDDGYNTRGIRLLIDLLRPKGKVVVVAPKFEMSGKSHSITGGVPLELTFIKKEDNYEEYSLDGTPVDCVKMGFDSVLKRRPDFLFAGINHGANTSINTLYSGTMAAAMEGCAENIPSVGFSLCDNDKNASLEECKPFVQSIIDNVLTNGLWDNICLNVNFPSGKIKGLKTCHQAEGFWSETFKTQNREDGQMIYWLEGEYHCIDKSDRADWNAVQQGYGAIVPMHVDFTAYNIIEKAKQRFDI